SCSSRRGRVGAARADRRRARRGGPRVGRRSGDAQRAGGEEGDGAVMTEPELRTSLLLVDDQPKNLLPLEEILEPLGQDLVFAHSGEEALKEVLRRDFAAILLD